jgi:hypothetical protein
VQKLSAPGVDISRLPQEVRELALEMKGSLPALLVEEGRLQASLVAQAGMPSADVILGALAGQLMQVHESEPVFDIKIAKAPTPIWETEGTFTPASPKDRLRPASYCQIFPTPLEAGVTYQIDMTSSQLDSYLRLEDPKGKVLAQDDDKGGKLNARIVYTPKQASLVHIVATTFGGRTTGAFKLSQQRLDAQQVLVVKLFVLRKAESLTADDPLGPRGKDQHARFYAVHLEAGVDYQIDLTSIDFDPFLRLEDESGRTLGSNDDGGFDLNARLRYRPTRSGTYRIVVTSYQANELGDFVLCVRK